MPFIVLDESPCDSHGVWWIRRVLDLGTSRYLIGQKKDPIIWLDQLSYTHRHAFIPFDQIIIEETPNPNTDAIVFDVYDEHTNQVFFFDCFLRIDPVKDGHYKEL